MKKIFFVAAACFSFLAIAHHPSYASEISPARMITVRASGRAELPPDRAEVMFSISAERDSYADASDHVMRSADVLRRAISAVTSGDMREDAPRIDSLVRKSSKTTYRARIDMSVDLPYDAGSCAAILRAAIDSGASPNISVGTYLSDERKVRDLALDAAVQEAKRRADILAESLGAKVGKIVSIESWIDAPVIARNAISMKNDMYEADSWNAEDVGVVESIICVWELR